MEKLKIAVEALKEIGDKFFWIQNHPGITSEAKSARARQALKALDACSPEGAVERPERVAFEHMDFQGAIYFIQMLEAYATTLEQRLEGK